MRCDKYNVCLKEFKDKKRTGKAYSQIPAKFNALLQVKINFIKFWVYKRFISIPSTVVETLTLRCPGGIQITIGVFGNSLFYRIICSSEFTLPSM